MTDVVETKVRAPTMTPEELYIISEFYAEHYDVFHSTLSGSSRQPKVKREEKTKTGGGMPPRYSIPAHVRILLDKLGNKPRVKGLLFGKDVCGVENESNVNQSMPTKRRAEDDTDPLSLTDNDEDLELDTSFHSEKLTLKKVKSEPRYVSRKIEDQQYRQTDTKLQSIIKEKENVPVRDLQDYGKLDNQHQPNEHLFNRDRQAMEHRHDEKNIKPRLKPKMAKTTETLEAERVHLQIKNERLTAELLQLQIEHTRLLNENAKLKNAKLRLQIDNELNGNDRTEDFDN